VDASPLGGGPEIVAVRIATDLDAPVSSGLPPAAARLTAFYGELRRVLDPLQRVGNPSIEGKRLSSNFQKRKSFSPIP